MVINALVRVRNSSKSRNHPLMKYVVFALFTAVLHGCTGSPSSSNQTGDFGGQTVRIIVPFGPGGGFDLNARLLAQRLGTYMQGNPTVVVENMPGAGGVVAARYFAHQARPDGLTLGIFSTALALLELTAEESESALDVSLNRFAIVGAPNPDIGICFFSPISGIPDIEAWTSAVRPPRMGMTGPGSGTYLATWLITDALELPIHPVAGYNGTAEIKHAMDGGEIDGTCATYASFTPVFGSQGIYNIVVQAGFEKSPSLPAVPLAMELAQSDGSRDMLDALALMRTIGRFYALPPGTPSDVVDQLRTAFLLTMEDPQFLLNAETAGLPIDPIAGPTVAASIASLLSLPESTRTRLTWIATHGGR